MKKPIIGVNADFEEKGGGYSVSPYHAVRENYLSPLTQQGAIPLILPPTTHDVMPYIDKIDGLLLTGGNDYDPALFGGSTNPDLNLKIMHQRSRFDLDLIQAALKKDIPILGICAGMQALNFFFKGTIYQDIQTECEGTLNHMQEIADVGRPAHDVLIEPNTLLSKIGDGVEKIAVNSFHHQAIKKPGEGLVVSGVAPDGIIEAIEYPSARFCLGVEWHPEYKVDPIDKKIFQAFIHAC